MEYGDWYTAFIATPRDKNSDKETDKSEQAAESEYMRIRRVG